MRNLERICARDGRSDCSSGLHAGHRPLDLEASISCVLRCLLHFIPIIITIIIIIILIILIIIYQNIPPSPWPLSRGRNRSSVGGSGGVHDLRQGQIALGGF